MPYTVANNDIINSNIKKYNPLFTIFILKDGTISIMDIKGDLVHLSYENNIPYDEIREVIIGSNVTSIGVSEIGRASCRERV